MVSPIPPAAALFLDGEDDDDDDGGKIIDGDGVRCSTGGTSRAAGMVEIMIVCLVMMMLFCVIPSETIDGDAGCGWQVRIGRSQEQRVC
jgi:hypothetical protein